MKEFRKDLSRWKEYDYVVINDDLKKCYDKIMLAIKKNKSSFDRNFIKKHIDQLLRQIFINFAYLKVFFFW